MSFSWQHIYIKNQSLPERVSLVQAAYRRIEMAIQNWRAKEADPQADSIMCALAKAVAQEAEVAFAIQWPNVKAILEGASPWRPIETAPKDGSYVILGWWDKKGTWSQTIGQIAYESRWSDEGEEEQPPREYWTDHTVAHWGAQEESEIPATHWAPLLLAPPRAEVTV